MPTRRTSDTGRQLREALAPYLDLRKLRAIAASGGDLQQAFHLEHPSYIPDEAQLLINALSALLRPDRRESIQSPQDVAGMLLVEMGALEQEQLQAVILDTKNHVIEVVMVFGARSILRWYASRKSLRRRSGATPLRSYSRTTTPLVTPPHPALYGE